SVGARYGYGSRESGLLPIGSACAETRLSYREKGSIGGLRPTRGYSRSIAENRATSAFDCAAPASEACWVDRPSNEHLQENAHALFACLCYAGDCACVRSSAHGTCTAAQTESHFER